MYRPFAVAADNRVQLPLRARTTAVLATWSDYMAREASYNEDLYWNFTRRRSPLSTIPGTSNHEALL